MLVASFNSRCAFSSTETLRDALKELVAHAHKLGIRIVVRASPAQPQLFDSTFTSAHVTRIIDEPECAFGMTYDAEAKLGADGCTTFTEEARWARQVPKVTPPLRNDVVGRAHAGKTVFLVTVQYFNAPDLSCGAVARSFMRRRDGS